MESKIRARLVIAGRVQGVLFRQSARAKALELGLSGWVHNLLDGKVADIGQVLEALKRRLKVETKESGLPEYTYHRGKLDVDICQPDEQAAAMAAELDNVDELHSAIRQDLGNDA